jgi:hypothetical protein
MEEHREKCLIEEKSHKKQIICPKDEVYGEERNLSVYLFCAKGCCLPGSLTKK